MALSGSFNTNKYTTSSSGTIGLNLSWTGTQSVTDNSTTISWTLKSNGTMSSGYYVKAGPVTVKINGTTVLHTTDRFNMKGGGAYKKTGKITVTHADDGTKTVAMSVSAAIYSTSVNCTGSKSFTLNQIYRYALIDSGDTFSDDVGSLGYPTVVYSNPAGTTLTTDLKLRILWANDTLSTNWVTLNDEGGSYTFTSSTLTAANIASIYNNDPYNNVIPIKYDLQSTFNDTEYHSYFSASMELVNPNPVAPQTPITYQDTNSTVVGKTGNNQIIVQNQSTLQIHINNFTPQKGASITAYVLDINGSTYTPDSSNNVTFTQPSLSGTYTATAVVTDSRGNTTTATRDITIQPWSEPTAVYSLERINNFETSTILFVDGSIASVSGTNTMTIKEQHRKVGDPSWSTAVTIADATDVTLSLNNNYSWEVLISVLDEYATTQYTATVGKGIPIMFIDTDLNSIGVNGYPDDDNQIYVDGTIKATGMVTCGDLNPTVVSTSVVSECIADYGTTCTINSTDFERAGRLCQLKISARRDSTCGSGGNILTGNLGSVAMQFAPAHTVTGGAYYSSRSIGFSVNSEGKFVVRNASSQSMSSGSGFEASITWLYAGPLPPVTS